MKVTVHKLLSDTQTRRKLCSDLVISMSLHKTLEINTNNTEDLDCSKGKMHKNQHMEGLENGFLCFNPAINHDKNIQFFRLFAAPTIWYPLQHPGYRHEGIYQRN